MAVLAKRANNCCHQAGEKLAAEAAKESLEFIPFQPYAIRSDPILSQARQGKAGQGRAGQGRAGQGRAGQGRAGQGRAGQGRAGQG